ncbi:MAG: cysteine desulfurase-like protein [Pseudomonadota bacterium]
MATTTFDVEAVRARYAALRRPLAFFDGPGGTQVPDEVIDAMGEYLRSANANSGGEFATSRATDALVTRARATAAGFLGCVPEEVAFGANMTTLNFALTRAFGRELRPGDELLVTKLDHDANVAPWLHLADDLGLRVQFVDLQDDTTLDVDDLERRLSDRTRVLAFPWAANSVGTVQDVARLSALAHGVGALAWVDAVHYAPHGPIDLAAAGADVLLCSPYKFFGPHLGVAVARRELLEAWRPYKVRPAPEEPPGHRYETGTLPFELLAGFVAAVDYLGSIGWDAIRGHERALGQRLLDGLPHGCTLHGLPTMDGRVPTFALTFERHSPAAVATALGEQGFAVWHGNYYAVETMRRLGLEDGGAVRVGFVHYNTPDEVDRLLDALHAL